MDDYLVAVIVGGIVVDLFYSRNLSELDAVRALNKGCKIDVMRLRKPVRTTVPVPATELGTKRREPNRPVRCVETGTVYGSVTEASVSMLIPKDNIYKSLRQHIAAYGYHFEYEER